MSAKACAVSIQKNVMGKPQLASCRQFDVNYFAIVDIGAVSTDSVVCVEGRFGYGYNDVHSACKQTLLTRCVFKPIHPNRCCAQMPSLLLAKTA